MTTDNPPPKSAASDSVGALAGSQFFSSRKFAAVFFAANLALVYSTFLPNLSEINPWDEAAYVNAGRLVWSGGLPPLADNPLVALLYGLTYLPFASSPFWLIHSTSLGRLLLYALLWTSAYKVARQLKPRPLIMLGLLFVTPLSIGFLRFPSDPLFAGLAGLSFASLLQYQREQDLRSLRNASIYMGLASLARSDGLLLGVLLVAIAVIVAKPSRRLRSLLESSGPWIAIAVGYVMIRGVLTGNFATGVPERTYDNFESGQQIVLEAGVEGVNPVAQARQQARQVFGTPEANNGSVFTAIRRNPEAYWSRLRPTITGLPRALLQAYGIRFAVPLFLLAAAGLLELRRTGGWRAVLPFLLWPTHLASGLVITIFREGHLQFPFYVVFGLASIGLAATVSQVTDRRTRAIWLSLLGMLTLYGVVDNKLAIAYGCGALAIGLLFAWLLQREMKQALAASFLVLFIGGVILRDGFPSPKLRSLGQRADEQAVVYMQQELEEGSLVAAGSPGPVWMAKMRFFNLAGTDVPRGRSSEEFLDWMLIQDVAAIYVDHTLSSVNAYFWELISDRIGHELERGYVADEGDIQVLLVVAD